MLGAMMNYPLTLAQILDHANRIHGDKHVHTLLPNGKMDTYNYAMLYRRVKQLANAITELGIRPGDRVATFASNTYQHLEIYCAVPYAGAIIHPLNVRLAPTQLAKIVEEADDKFIFVDGTCAAQFSQLQYKIDCRRVVLFNANHVHDKNLTDLSIDYENIIAEAEDNYISDIPDENWAMALCYTSGTGGEPKGVLYTHRSMFLHTLAVNQADVFGLTESDVVMPLVPMFHAMGWGLPYAAMFVGADIVLADTNNERIVDLIAEIGVTVAAGVPTVWTKLLPEFRKRKQDISSLQRLIVGGEPIPSSLIEAYEKELGVEVRHAWGMTEMSPTGTFCTLRKAHQNLPDDEKWKIKAMQGRPIPGVQMRLVNENGTELPWDGNAIGEVQVKSPWTVSSYYKNEPTPEHFTVDRWLRTGDLATINSEGYMQIVGRAKALIRSGGESISTVALENVLLKYPHVKDAAVIGIPNEKWGERPIAVVVLSSKTNENISEILKCHLASEFPKFWIPDRFIIVDEIPKTGVGKTDKQAIIELITASQKGELL
ncbi:MAG: long-chain-fatty-acid--CoA ligase [Candidatus Poribacteria bacterium]|nr:long-chain-fatty-acid--CoA ligase [Candidatus Poribacteria bacterium]